jgi:hypothetical protein
MLLIYNFTSYCSLSIQIEIFFIAKLDIFPLICAEVWITTLTLILSSNSLMLYTFQRSSEYKFYSLWIDLTGT